MKNTLLLTALLFVNGYGIAQTVEPEWVHHYGSSFLDFGYAMAIDDSDNSIVAGNFGDTIDMDPTSGVDQYVPTGWIDMFIQKSNSSGDIIWTKVIESIDQNGHAEPLEVLTDASDNIFIAGRFNNGKDFDPGPGVYPLTATSGGYDIFIMKLDASGNFQWVKTVGGTGIHDRPFGMAMDSSGNLVIVGGYSDSFDFDPGAGVFTMSAPVAYSSVFILKLDPNGDFIWARSMEGTENSTAYAVDVDGSSNVIVSGRFAGTIDLDPGTGVDSRTTSGYSDAFIIKLNASGDYQWGHSYAEDSRSVYCNSNDEILLLGTNSGTTQFGASIQDTLTTLDYAMFIQKLSPSGDNIWVKALNFTEGGFTSDIIANPSDEIYISGGYGGIGDFDPGPGQYLDTVQETWDGFILKLTDNGDFLWVYTMEGDLGQLIFDTDLDSQGAIYATGQYYLDCNFHGTTGIVNSAGHNDIFALKLNPLASLQEVSAAPEMMLHPNPASSSFIVEFTDHQNRNVEMYSGTGQLIFSLEVQEKKEIDVSALKPGVYFVKSTSAIGSSVQKLIIQ